MMDVLLSRKKYKIDCCIVPNACHIYKFTGSLGGINSKALKAKKIHQKNVLLMRLTQTLHISPFYKQDSTLKMSILDVAENFVVRGQKKCKCSSFFLVVT